MEKGIFISFEGLDGSGKSTQMEYLRQYLDERGIPSVFVREPGGTSIGEKIRSIILDRQNAGMDPVTEAMLYAASRAQLVSEVIEPALAAGKVVVCDRYIDSSVAYQSFGRGLKYKVAEINEHAVRGVMPDVTFWLDVPPETGRVRRTGREQDRLEAEQEAFFYRVQEGYQKLAEHFPERIMRLDGSLDREEIRERIVGFVKDMLDRRDAADWGEMADFPADGEA